MSETSGLTPDDIAILWYGAIFQLTAKPPVPVSCSYLAAWGNYTKDGSVIVSRNWDLDDAVMPFTKWYVLTVSGQRTAAMALPPGAPRGCGRRAS